MFVAQKLAYMSYVGLVNFVISSVIAQFIKEYISSPYDEKKSLLHNAFTFYSTIACIILGAYVTRQMIELIPTSMWETATFSPQKIKESRVTVATAYAYLMYLSDDLETYKNVLLKIFWCAGSKMHPDDRPVPYSSDGACWRLGQQWSKLPADFLSESTVFTPEYARWMVEKPDWSFERRKQTVASETWYLRKELCGLFEEFNRIKEYVRSLTKTFGIDSQVIIKTSTDSFGKWQSSVSVHQNLDLRRLRTVLMMLSVKIWMGSPMTDMTLGVRACG